MTTPLHLRMPRHDGGVRFSSAWFNQRDPVTDRDAGIRMARAFGHVIQFRLSFPEVQVWPRRYSRAEDERLILVRTVGTRELSR